jgi:UDP-N-acetylmuramoyl-tripeptide--D-alanyl-D-alanine ligase
MATPIPLNRCVFTLGEVAAATGGTLFGAENAQVRGIATDTRTLKPGALFVALKAVRDGHDFLTAAARGGAAGAIVARGRRDPELPCVETDDTLEALGNLARYHLSRMRARGPIPSIAIGGAAGKTTTKELTAAVVRSLFGPTLATPGNLNNLIGVPMTLLMLTGKHRAMVIECGTNTRGEIARLASILSPDVAMVLNVDVEHTEGLGTLEEIADEETSIFKRARTAVVSSDEPIVRSRIPDGMRVVTFGESNNPDIRVIRRTVARDGRSVIVLGFGGAFVQNGTAPRIEAHLALLGATTATNAAAAVAAAAAAYGYPFGADELAAIQRALESVEPVAGRLSARTIANVLVIDDTYNSNPRSVRAALAAVREAADALDARMVVALGDMLELGELTEPAHAEAVREALSLKPAAFIAVGNEMTAACRTVAESLDGRPSTMLSAADANEASRLIRQVVRAGDVLLVKGSRGIRMERVIEALAHSASPTG